MANYSRQSSRIAIGGVFSALCLLVMLLSFLPATSYAAPMLAGAMIIVVVDECGGKMAFLVYITVSLLSLFMVTNYEAKAIFIGFAGYYPIIRPFIEKHLPKVVGYIVKLVIFNIAIIAIYAILIFVLKLPDVTEDMGDFGKYSSIILLVMGNIVFLIYDFSLNIYMLFYKQRLKPIISKE